MINSGALPNVAFRKPPTPGPVWYAAFSVASPISQASGISAVAASAKTASCPIAPSQSSTTTIGPSASSAHSDVRVRLRTVTEGAKAR